MLLLVGGVVCIFAPSWILSASGMGSLEDESFFVWGVRVLGCVFVGISLWALFGRR